MIICDLDGTLAKPAPGAEHCLGSMTREQILQIMDPVVVARLEPRLDVIKMLTEMSKYTDVFIVTGRWDILRAVTYAWLTEHKVPFYRLFMRKYEDWPRPSVAVKLELYNEIKRLHNQSGTEQLVWIDDDHMMLDAVERFCDRTVKI